MQDHSLHNKFPSARDSTSFNEEQTTAHAVRFDFESACNIQSRVKCSGLKPAVISTQTMDARTLCTNSVNK
jgi:hypothetical protein